MSKSINLDELLRAMHNSVLEAQKLTEAQHIRQLHNYFEWPNDEIPEGDKLFEHMHSGRGKARTWTIEVPSMLPSSSAPAKNNDEGASNGQEMVAIQVPIMSLIPPTAIKIKNMVVDFKVAIRGFNFDKPKKTKRFHPGDITEHKGPLEIDLGGISGGGYFGKKPILANVKIEFEAGEPSEAFLRVNDHLIKSII